MFALLLAGLLVGGCGGKIARHRCRRARGRGAGLGEDRWSC